MKHEPFNIAGVKEISDTLQRHGNKFQAVTAEAKLLRDQRSAAEALDQAKVDRSMSTMAKQERIQVWYSPAVLLKQDLEQRLAAAFEQP